MELDERTALIDEMLERFESRQDAKKVAEAAKAQEREALKAEVRKEVEAETKAWKEKNGSVHLMEKAKRGSGGTPDGGDVETFRYWMRTGDDVAARKSLEESDDTEAGNSVDGMSRKALAEGTGSAGGFVVPTQIVAGIIQKRDALSFPRRMGVRVLQTNLFTVDLPTEDTSLTVFARTAEAGTYTTNDPTIAQNQVVVQKWTKHTKFAEELLADDPGSAVESFYADGVGRAWAATEARYVATGTGTNQHEGIFVGGDTDALTYSTTVGGMDSDRNYLPAAPWLLYFTLGEGYRNDAAWLMNDDTLQKLVTLRHASANPNWAFQAADILEFGAGGQISLMGKPVYTQANIATDATAVCVMMFGSPAYYVLVERAGLVIQRNPYLSMGTGQVDFFSSFRQSGKVLVEAAWVGAVAI